MFHTPHQNRRRLEAVFGGVEPTWHPRVHPSAETRYQVGRSSAHQRDLLPKQVDPTSHWCQNRPSRVFPAKPRLGVFSRWIPRTLWGQPMLFAMPGSTSWNSSEGRRSSSQNVLPPVPAVQTDGFQGFPGCMLRRPDGVRAVVQLERLCVRLARDGRGGYCSTIGTTFSLQLPGDHPSVIDYGRPDGSYTDMNEPVPEYSFWPWALAVH